MRPALIGASTRAMLSLYRWSRHARDAHVRDRRAPKDVTELDTDDADAYVLLHEWLAPVDHPEQPFDLRIFSGFAQLVYNDGCTQALDTPFYMDDMIRLTHTHPFTDAGRTVIRIHTFFNVRAFVAQMNEGKPSRHRQMLCHQMSLSELRTTTSIDPRRIERTTHISVMHTDEFKAIVNAPPHATVPEGLVKPDLFKTPLWGVQRYFLARAIDLDADGILMFSYTSHHKRVANANGDVFFVDCQRQRLVHSDDVGPPIADRVHGGFLLERVGLGKTFSMLALCATHPAPPLHHLDDDFKPRRMPDGRMVSRATLIVCPAQVCTHWATQIETHLSGTYRTLVISSKREHARYTFEDVMSADFVIITFNFITNAKFRACLEAYGTGGWSNFRVRLDNSLHDSKRRRGDDFAKFTELSIAHVHFWRLIVDEFHELSFYNNRPVESAINAIEARSRWGISASIMGTENTFNTCLEYVLAPRMSILTDSAYARMRKNYDCSQHFMRRCFIKSDPSALVDMVLPTIVEHVHWLRFTPDERSVYNSLHHSYDAQIRACCMPRLTSNEIPEMLDCASIEAAMERIHEHMEKKRDQASVAATHWTSMATLVTQQIETTGSNRAFMAALSQADRQASVWTKRRDDAERSLRFIHASAEIGDECPICCEDMSDPHIIECGHVFCAQCCTRILGMLTTSPPQCPTCRTPLLNTTGIARVRSPCMLESDVLVRTHGTKVAAIINFMHVAISTDPTEKFLMFSRFDPLLHAIGDLLKTHFHVLFCKGSQAEKQKAINSFTTSPKHPLLLLSSQFSGSGVCLTAARNVIILDVPTGSPAVIAETEKQVVGRCYRPPQDREVRVHRFLIEDSIESKVYDSTLRHIDLKAIWEQRTT